MALYEFYMAHPNANADFKVTLEVDHKKRRNPIAVGVDFLSRRKMSGMHYVRDWTRIQPTVMTRLNVERWVYA